MGGTHGLAEQPHGARADLHLVALDGFIKKTRTTPEEEMALARKRQKELER